MNLRLFSLAAALFALSTPGFAADRNYSVTGFDRIRVDGPYRIATTTGVAPFARASGSPAALDDISIQVQGRTLVVRKNSSSWGGYPGESPGPVEIAVGTHELTTVWVNGAGSLSIDSVEGFSFDLSLQGPGSVAIGRLDVDRLRVGLTGAGSAVLGGKAAEAITIARGTGSIDGSALTVKDVTIGAEGSAVVKLRTSGTAKVDATGTAIVELAGRPACTVRASGSAVVSGCR
ncbi:MAG TPA: DUF2807 domain-containing protein [Sphingomicrobium sp.]|nr:DUF2807 domain-containing protein [Sphingomicrobium sp.]